MQLWALILCVLWYAVVPTFACPQRCSCHHEQGLYVANCSSLPYNGGKVEVLNLHRSPDDHPLELHDGQFNSAKHLKYLNLRNSSIYFIHKKAFYGAKSLIEIDLSFNQIQEIEPTVFQHLTGFTTLILRGNPIQFVMEVPFLISNTLQHLDIGQCNIRSVPRGIFYGLKRLKYLSMDGNLLKSLKYNSLPKGLKFLNLSQNLIEDVPTEVLSALTNLRRIGLSGNPINCTCSLLNFQDYISGRGVAFEEDVTCAVPSEYYGVSLSKIDENKLCLAEARREDVSHPLLKNRFYAENYLVNDHGYLDEDFQADEPSTLLTDSQSEVLFQNSETKAMGEMMRDEEHPTNSENEKKETEETKVNEFPTKLDLEKPEEAKVEEHSVEQNEDAVTESKAPSERENKDIQETNENLESQKIEEESKAKNEDNLLNGSQSTPDVIPEKPDLALEDTNANLNTNNDKHLEPSEEEVAEDIEHNKNSVDVIAAANDTEEKMSLLAKEDLIENNSQENENVSNIQTSPSLNQNESHQEEYKPLTPDVNRTESVDELAEEGLLLANIDENKVTTNESSEDSTIMPDLSETTDDDLISTQETFVEGLSEANTTSVGDSLRSAPNDTGIVDDSSPTPNNTFGEDTSKELSVNVSASEQESTELPESDNTTKSPGSETEVSMEEVIEDITPAVTNRTVIQHEIIPPPENRKPDSSERAALKEGENKLEDKEKIKQVAGADIVMFCIAILVICLVLFSVYKCRSSRSRQSIRVPKDVESNRGTEMQDMASLLPKPEDDDKKNHKYPDKEPSSETMKLIPETNEKESPNYPTAPEQNNVENKNLINNNAPGSPTSKTPLIKPSHPVKINPAAPIQRTKAKVGIIPDSIPRTPIFLQKTYTNGTKHV